MAGMLSFPCVHHEMLLKVALWPKSLPTVATCVRLPIIEVQLCMPRQVRCIPELPATSGTLVGFLSHVDPLVNDKMRFSRKLLVAWWAGEGPESSMCSLMPHHMVPLIGGVWAEGALQSPLRPWCMAVLHVFVEIALRGQEVPTLRTAEYGRTRGSRADLVLLVIEQFA